VESARGAIYRGDLINTKTPRYENRRKAVKYDVRKDQQAQIGMARGLPALKDGSYKFPG
jgi:hypothetical protein